jgi:hypothetical protein
MIDVEMHEEYFRIENISGQPVLPMKQQWSAQVWGDMQSSIGGSMQVIRKRVSWIFAALVLAMPLGTAAAARQAAFDTSAIEQATGLKGTYVEEEGVFKIGFPRNDVKVTVDGKPLPPFMGLTSTALFKHGHGSQLMMMGDTVLFQDEVNPVMSVALDSGLQVTALHNHFFFDEPKVYFMHIEGEADPGKLAGAVKKLYDKIKEIRAANSQPAARFSGTRAPEQNAITAAPLEKIFGTKGDANNGMFKVVFGRSAHMHDVQVGKEMGVNTWAAFAGIDDNAVVDGDFAMRESELQGVLKGMRKKGINIVAIHHHMTNEQPRYIFLHYWGIGKAQDLARAVKHVIDTQTNTESDVKPETK